MQETWTSETILKKLREGLDDDSFKKIELIAKKLKTDDWDKIFKTYQFRDIKNSLSDNGNAIPFIIKSLSAIIYDMSKDFYNADRLHHESVRGIKVIEHKKEKIPCVKAYAHFLLGRKRFFHAENVLKFEIRSDQFCQRGEKEFADLYFLLGLVLMAERLYYYSKEAFLLYLNSLIVHALDMNGGSGTTSEFKYVDDVANESDLDGFLTHVESMVEHIPSDFKEDITMGFRYVGSALDGIGNKIELNKAKKYLEATYVVSPDSSHTALAYNDLADIYINEYHHEKGETLIEAKRKVTKAEEIMKKNEKKLKEEGRMLDYNYYLSMIYDTAALVNMSEKNLKRSLGYLTQAYDLRKQHPVPPTAILFHRGMIYERKNDLKMAREEYEEAIQTRDKSDVKRRYVAKAYVALGMLEIKEKNLEQAKKNFESALDFDPDNADAAQNLRYLNARESSQVDWWTWWSKPRAKKAALFALVATAVLVVLIPFIVDNVVEEVITHTSKDQEIKITKKNPFADYNFTIVAIIAFIILLPSISKLKAGPLEIESKGMYAKDDSRPPTLPYSL